MTFYQYLEQFLKKQFKLMNKLIVNGIEHMVEGNNVSIVKRSIVVNGKIIVDNIVGDSVHVKWEGDLANLDCTSCEITGNVNGRVDSTSVRCGNVGGNVDATSVRCGNIGGRVDATSVNCETIMGNVDALKVKQRKD